MGAMPDPHDRFDPTDPPETSPSDPQAGPRSGTGPGSDAGSDAGSGTAAQAKTDGAGAQVERVFGRSAGQVGGQVAGPVGGQVAGPVAKPTSGQDGAPSDAAGPGLSERVAAKGPAQASEKELAREQEPAREQEQAGETVPLPGSAQAPRAPSPAETGAAPERETLLGLLDAMRPQEGDTRVSVADILTRIGGRSFPAVILVPAVMLVSPISGIPGTPTIGALIVLLITAQVLIGRKSLWLPGILTRRSVAADKMSKAITWLSKPAGWMDRHSHGRLRILTTGPTRLIAYLATAVMAASWPLMELLPFVTSFSAGAVSMIMFGLMTRDGAYTLAGYVQAVVLYLILLSTVTGLI